MPELAGFDAAAPATVKKCAPTPCRVKPDLAVKVMVAVYCVFTANLPETAGYQVTVPLYWFVSTAVTGIAPATGITIPGIAAVLITAGAVWGNNAVTIPALAALVTVVAPATVKKFSPIPCRVKPSFAVRVMVAVYSCEPWKGL